MDQVCGEICYSKRRATVQEYEAVFIAIFQIGNNINIAQTFKRNDVGIQKVSLHSHLSPPSRFSPKGSTSTELIIFPDFFMHTYKLIVHIYT